MNKQFSKRAALLTVVLALLLCLCGCEKLDYREAVELYNNGRYAQAAQIFSALGDYEDSADLLKRCHYWSAVDTMEAENWQSALAQFQELETYRDSQARITECTYRLAVLAFESGDYAGAESRFLETADYKNAPEYLRQIRWQKLYDYITANGTEGDGCFVISDQWEERTVTLMVDMTTPSQIQMHVGKDRYEGYTFTDRLSVTMTRDSKLASFIGTSSFTMEFGDSQIGSRQEISGQVAFDAITPQSLPTAQSFEMTVVDNHGNTTTSTDPADSRMEAEMAENWRILFSTLPELVAPSGVALSDLGFTQF